MARVIAITGAAGYIAQHLIQYLGDNLPDCESILGVDIKKSNLKVDFPYNHYCADILNLKSSFLEEYGITDLIHMAWTVTPTHDHTRAYKIDIQGTKHVLEQALDAKVKYFLHTSSTLAYGAYNDNPEFLSESNPLRGNQSFHYSNHKMLAEKALDNFEKDFGKKIKIGRIRPSPILSADLDNFVTTILKGGWRTFFLMPHPDPDTPIQFMHVEDAIQAFYLMVSKRLEGAYNATPNETIRVGEIPRLLKGRGIHIPLKVLKLLLWFQWNLRISEVPPSYLDFVAYPYVASNNKLSKEGFSPNYTTEDTLDCLR